MPEIFQPSLSGAVDQELEHHMEERVERLMEQGFSESEARAEAMRRMGDMDRYRREMMVTGVSDDGRGWIMGGLEALLQDIRYALRGIRKNPGFAWTLIATLALGIGATGAIFSVVDAAMLRPLPYRDADRLVDVNHRISEDFTIPEMMSDQVVPWTQGADFLSATAFHGRRAMVRTDQGEPVQLSVGIASPSLDEVLGFDAAFGRSFGEDDALPGARTVILTNGYWLATGLGRDVLGTQMELDGEQWTVIGVLPPGLKYPVVGTRDVWIPLASDRTAAGRPLTRLGVVGRLADGVSLDVAKERAESLGTALAEEVPNQAGWSTNLVPVGEWRGNPDTRRGLWMVSGAVGLMLLIAVFNGINLLLVRAHARLPEVGIRKALGASRWRVVHQVLAESVMLALLGGVVATGVAWASVQGIGMIAPSELTFGMAHDFGLEGRALAAVFAIATLVGLVMGVIPALALATAGLQGAGSSRARMRGRGANRLRGMLVGAEVATSVVLLVGAGLFLRSFSNMNAVDLGMDAERLAFAGVQLPNGRYPTGADRSTFVLDVLTRLSAIPGVESAIVAQGLPPEGGGLTFGSGLQGEGRDAIEADVILPFGYATEGYFETLGTQLISGRALTGADRETDGVVIDRDLAMRLFGEADVAQRRMRLSEDGAWLLIVGVVEELRFGGVDDNMGDGVVLYPMNTDAPPSYLDFAVRTSRPPEAVLQQMRVSIQAVDDQLPLRELSTAERAMAEATIRPRFLVLLMSVLAGIALLLAGVGLYGVLSYVVRQRRREIGIRIALGAPLSGLRAGVVGWGMGVGVIGSAVGLWAAFLLDDFIAALLFGVEPGDVATRVGVTGAMLAVTFVACVLPAHRATRVDPVEVLSAE